LNGESCLSQNLEVMTEWTERLWDWV
jgi:hypothetical protein